MDTVAVWLGIISVVVAGGYAAGRWFAAARLRDDRRSALWALSKVVAGALMVGIGGAMVGFGWSPRHLRDAAVIGSSFGAAAAAVIAWRRAGETTRVGVLVSTGLLAAFTAYASAGPD